MMSDKLHSERMAVLYLGVSFVHVAIVVGQFFLHWDLFFEQFILISSSFIPIAYIVLGVRMMKKNFIFSKQTQSVPANNFFSQGKENIPTKNFLSPKNLLLSNFVVLLIFFLVLAYLKRVVGVDMGGVFVQTVGFFMVVVYFLSTVFISIFGYKNFLIPKNVLLSNLVVLPVLFLLVVCFELVLGVDSIWVMVLGFFMAVVYFLFTVFMSIFGDQKMSNIRRKPFENTSIATRLINGFPLYCLFLAIILFVVVLTGLSELDRYRSNRFYKENPGALLREIENDRERAVQSNREATVQKEAIAPISVETAVGSIELAKISPTEQKVVNINSPSDEPVAVTMRVIRALKLTPGANGNTVSLQACSVAGCLPGHDVVVGAGEAIIKVDATFSNPRIVTDNSGADDAYFKAQESRFSVSNTYFPVLELRQGPTGNWVEQGPSFYIEPLKVHQQTFFVRVPKDTKSVELIYGEDLSQPVFMFQACFMESCDSGFLK